MTPKQSKDILRMLKTERNPIHIAGMVGVSPTEVRYLMQDLPILEGWGRLGIQRYIVSRRLATLPWPSKDNLIIRKAQREHDQGIKTMCQGRDGEWIIQYATPNHPAVHRAAYFTGL